MNSAGPLPFQSYRHRGREIRVEGVQGCDLTAIRETRHVWPSFAVYLYHPGGWDRRALCQSLLQSEPLQAAFSRATRSRLTKEDLVVDVDGVEIRGYSGWLHRASWADIEELEESLLAEMVPHLEPDTGGCRSCGEPGTVQILGGVGLRLCQGCQLRSSPATPRPRLLLGLAWLALVFTDLLVFGSSLTWVTLRKISKIGLFSLLWWPRVVSPPPPPPRLSESPAVLEARALAEESSPLARARALAQLGRTEEALQAVEQAIPSTDCELLRLELLRDQPEEFQRHRDRLRQAQPDEAIWWEV